MWPWSLGQLTRLHKSSFIKWERARVTSSAHFMNSAGLQMSVKVMQHWRPEHFLSTQVISLRSHAYCKHMGEIKCWSTHSSLISWPKILPVMRGARHLWQFFTMTQPSIPVPALCPSLLSMLYMQYIWSNITTHLVTEKHRKSANLKQYVKTIRGVNL